MLQSEASPNVYSDSRHQVDGILIASAGGNVIGSITNPGLGNVILGNQTGIAIQGTGATNNEIVNNTIGPRTYTPGSPNINGLGNFYGIYVANAQANDVWKNSITRNISVGVAIVGSQADRNVVQANNISSNGGYGMVDAARGFVTVEPMTASAQVFGSGVYIQSGQFNTIGGGPGSLALPGLTLVGNTINDNTQVGVYLFGGASNNVVGLNTITGVSYPRGPFNGQYGVLLNNSPSNVLDIFQRGTFANKVSGFRIAGFFNFTGPSS